MTTARQAGPVLGEDAREAVNRALAHGDGYLTVREAGEAVIHALGPFVAAAVAAEGERVRRECAEELRAMARRVADDGPSGPDLAMATALSLQAQRWDPRPLDAETIRRGQELWKGREG